MSLAGSGLSSHVRAAGRGRGPWMGGGFVSVVVPGLVAWLLGS